MPIGDEVRDLRKRREWTQAELADRLGTDAVTVSRWERGVAKPRPSAVARLRQLEAVPEALAASIEALGFERAAAILHRQLLLTRGPRSSVRVVGDPAEIFRRAADLTLAQQRFKERAHVR